MSRLALYRQWRPMTFDEVVEQTHVVRTLKNSVQTGQTGHAYLFSGTRGTGKTTMAKILARAVNCLAPVDGNPCNECEICRGILDGTLLDVLEIDAASNNSVDDVRAIRDEVAYAPARARSKVYIIDEVHMLSGSAFNALLKTLEEPPEQVMFILATTEPQKLPPTVLSRCQRFDFKRITDKGIADRLGFIAAECGVELTEAARLLLARLSGGAMRDAVSLLDQMVSTGRTKLDDADVTELSGLASEQNIRALCGAIAAHDMPQAFDRLDRLISEGRDIVQLCAQMAGWYRNLLMVKIAGRDERIIDVRPEEAEELAGAANGISREEVLFILKELSAHEMFLKRTENPRILLEVLTMRLCSRTSPDGEDLLERIARLEARIAVLEQRPAMAGFAAGGIGAPGTAGAGMPAMDGSGAMGGMPQGASGGYPAGTPGGYPDGGPVAYAAGASASPGSGAATHAGSQTAGRSPDPRGAGASGASGRGRAAAGGSSELQRIWQKVIDAVRSAGSMKVYANLLDTSVRPGGPGIAVILVPSDDLLKKKVLSRAESTEVIAAALAGIAGGSWQIKVADENEAAPVQEPQADPLIEQLKAFSEQSGIPMTIRD